MVNVTFQNQLPIPIKIEWSNGDGTPIDSAVIQPLAAHTFRHGRGSNIDYGIYMERNGQWVKFDQDWVSMWSDRTGKVHKIEHPAVDWDSPFMWSEQAG